MRVVAEAMLSSAPAESRMRSRADVPVLGPDDRQVVAAVALVRPFETWRRKRCPATWGVRTYAGLLLAETEAGALGYRTSALPIQARRRRTRLPIRVVGVGIANGAIEMTLRSSALATVG
jgi:hypothetical protein